MLKKTALGITMFLMVAIILFAEETFMIFNTPVTIEFLKNDPGKGRSCALNLQNYLEDNRIRYRDVNSQTENEMYIREIVRRHTIRRGDIYYISAYFSLFGETKIGVCEFTSDTQYTYWFYMYAGR